MAYNEDKAFELIESAFQRGRLGHAFIISGTKYAGVESLTTRIVNLINREEKSDNTGDVMNDFDLFGEVTNEDKPPEPEAEDLADLEGELVRIVRPMMKSRIISVDAIRELEKTMFKSVPKGKHKVGIIVDADRMRTEAANAFLKTLEEPPSGSILFLLTPSPERLLSTILSRCVNIPLIAEKDQREELEGEQEMISVLMKNAKLGFNSIARALTIKSVFATLLNKRKLAIGKIHDASLKEEQSQYKNTTDGDWLKDREKHYESLAQSDYLFERSKFIDLLILCLGDLVRVKAGAPKLDFNKHEVAMREAVEKESLESLLLRMDAMEELRGLFETNASEALALEVCFLKAFA